MMATLRICVGLCLSATAYALDNGLGLTPQMGYSSWNDCGSVVTEAHIKATASYMVSSGLAAKGYTYVNVDEGWLVGREKTAPYAMVEDKKAFPSTMAGLGKWIHSLDVPGRGKIMQYGLYTCRGVQQCDTGEYIKRCEAAQASGLMPSQTKGRCEGSHGFEKQDAQWLVDAGADYLKEDSCGGNQTHSVAFSDYAKMRDYLNSSATAAGKKVFFSLCGWESWYAPPDPTAKSEKLPTGYDGGPSLGNSYRIHGDGSNWDHLSGCTNTIAAIGKWSKPGGWADPDLLIGPESGKSGDDHIGGQTDEQARTQFNLWAVFPAPLLISQNVLKWSKYALETYSNTDVIAINQDPVQPGASGEGSGFKVGKRLVGGDLALPCHLPINCTNVWGRPLADGKSFALAMVNNGNTTATVGCDTACFTALLDGATPAAKYTVKDLWSKSEDTVVLAPDAAVGFSYSTSVPPQGGSRLFKVTAG